MNKNKLIFKNDWFYPNPKTTDPTEHAIQRTFEIIPGALTWTTIVGMFIFSYFLPIWVAFFIIAYDTYWLYRTIYISIYSILAYRKMKQWKKINWFHRLKKLDRPDELMKELEFEISQFKKQIKGAKHRKMKRELKNALAERKGFLETFKKDIKHKKHFINS